MTSADTATFDPVALVAAASTETGLTDFGPDSFRAGLEVYCGSVRSEAQLNEFGAVAVRANVVGNLVNRLRIVDWAKHHPDVAAERIDAPVVVIGMFRAGTTLLSYLLDQDARNRALLHWEAQSSVPPPQPDTRRSDPRIDQSRAGRDALDQINPRIKVVHSEEPDGPTECITVMSQDFKSLAWEAVSNVPSYSRWLLGTDQRSAYEHHRLTLQVLQSGGVRGRWTLKSPHHAIALDALTAVYPDARLVLLHRDPAVLCASVCSLIRTLTGTFSNADHQRYIAEHWPAMLEESISRIDVFRAANPAFPIVDVQYADLVRDPVQTVSDLYAALGDELVEPARRAIAAYIDSHPRGRFGVHGYDLADFGLDAGDIAARFAGYTERYGVELERER